MSMITAQIELDFKQLDRAKDRVLGLLKDHQWHSTAEICEVGGTEGTRRLRELRLDDGYDIVKEKVPGRGNGFRYRLRKWNLN